MRSFSFRNQELSLKRELRASLNRIYGVGFSKAFNITSRLGFCYPYFSEKLNSYQISLITGLLNKLILSEVKSKRNIELIIKNLIEIGTYRGKRHSLFLPTRGQRTRTNGRTLKRLKYKNK